MRHDIQRSNLDRRITRLVEAQNRRRVAPLARLVLYALGVEIPRGVKPGPGFVLVHPTAGIVIHPRTVIGANVTMFHGVTIGRSNPWEPHPDGDPSRVVIEDDVVIAAGACLLFTPGRDLVIGRGVIIGANAVITRDVPPGEVWTGNPARSTGVRA